MRHNGGGSTTTLTYEPGLKEVPVIFEKSMGSNLVVAPPYRGRELGKGKEGGGVGRCELVIQQIPNITHPNSLKLRHFSACNIANCFDR